jgi:hypothetical protein
MEDIICSIESITHQLPIMKPKKLGRNAGRILHRSKPPKPNLTKEQFDSIHHLNENPDILVLKVDKGNATVIMNSSDYESKLLDLLSSSTYKT